MRTFRSRYRRGRWAGMCPVGAFMFALTTRSPRARPVHWWMVWHPHSGMFGGLVLGLAIFGLLTLIRGCGK